LSTIEARWSCVEKKPQIDRSEFVLAVAAGRKAKYYSLRSKKDVKDLSKFEYIYKLNHV
jgi:hypothetical protein